MHRSGDAASFEAIGTCLKRRWVSGGFDASTRRWSVMVCVTPALLFNYLHGKIKGLKYCAFKLSVQSYFPES